MAQCVQRSLRECLRGKLKLLQRGTRSLSDQTFVKQTTSPEEHVFLDLELVHKEWKTAGYFPRYRLLCVAEWGVKGEHT